MHQNTLYLRAKRASNLQGASFFLGCIEKRFPLGCRLRGNFIEKDLIGEWQQCVIGKLIGQWGTLLDSSNSI